MDTPFSASAKITTWDGMAHSIMYEYNRVSRFSQFECEFEKFSLTLVLRLKNVHTLLFFFFLKFAKKILLLFLSKNAKINNILF